MERKVYEDALYAVNLARKERGFCQLERLPSGRRGRATQCPMAYALRSVFGLNFVGISGSIRELPVSDTAPERDRVLGEVIRPEVQTFADAFDKGCYVAGVLPGGECDPATLVPEYREQVPEVKEERVPEGAK